MDAKAKKATGDEAKVAAVEAQVNKAKGGEPNAVGVEVKAKKVKGKKIKEVEEEAKPRRKRPLGSKTARVAAEGEDNASICTVGIQGRAAGGLRPRCVTPCCTGLRAPKGGKCPRCRYLAKKARVVTEGEADASRSMAGAEGKASACFRLCCVMPGCTAPRALKGGKCPTCRYSAKKASEKRLQEQAKKIPTKKYKGKKDA